MSTYLFRTIHSDKPVRVTAGLGSDDGLEVWLNGAKLLVRNVARGLSPNADQVPLDLRPGENRLLLKIHNTRRRTRLLLLARYFPHARPPSARRSSNTRRAPAACLDPRRPSKT